jgi:hypothetical protein
VYSPAGTLHHPPACMQEGFMSGMYTLVQDKPRDIWQVTTTKVRACTAAC